MRKTKGNLESGITLIALIITIIVMLILVAVTVSVVVDSDIIGQAEKAGDLYKDAYANEGEKVSDETIEGEGLRHNTIDGYIQDICEHNFVAGKCTKCDFQLIKFTIDETEYYTEPGMTWEEWLQSDLCTGLTKEIEISAEGELTAHNLGYCDGCRWELVSAPLASSDGTFVTPEDLIHDNAWYNFYCLFCKDFAQL